MLERHDSRLGGPSFTAVPRAWVRLELPVMSGHSNTILSFNYFA